MPDTETWWLSPTDTCGRPPLAQVSIGDKAVRNPWRRQSKASPRSRWVRHRSLADQLAGPKVEGLFRGINALSGHYRFSCCLSDRHSGSRKRVSCALFSAVAGESECTSGCGIGGCIPKNESVAHLRSCDAYLRGRRDTCRRDCHLLPSGKVAYRRHRPSNGVIAGLSWRVCQRARQQG
jgi:hypothetical protein